MPRSAFYKISKGKQARILTYAMAEFEKNTLKKSSMTNIINRSKVSRGSFYLYFEDIEDVYHEVLRFNIETIILQSKDAIVKCTSMDEYFTHIFEVILDGFLKHKGYVQNVIMSMDTDLKTTLDEEIAKHDLNKGHSMKAIIDKYEPDIDVSTTERLLLFREMSLDTLINACKEFAIGNKTKEQVIKTMLAKGQIIKKGFSK